MRHCACCRIRIGSDACARVRLRRVLVPPRHAAQYPGSDLGRVVATVMIVVMLVQVPIQISKVSAFFEGASELEELRNDVQRIAQRLGVGAAVAGQGRSSLGDDGNHGHSDFGPANPGADADAGDTPPSQQLSRSQLRTRLAAQVDDATLGKVAVALSVRTRTSDGASGRAAATSKMATVDAVLVALFGKLPAVAGAGTLRRSQAHPHGRPSTARGSGATRRSGAQGPGMHGMVAAAASRRPARDTSASSRTILEA